MFIIQCPILWYATVCALPSVRSSFFFIVVILRVERFLLRLECDHRLVEIDQLLSHRAPHCVWKYLEDTLPSCAPPSSSSLNWASTAGWTGAPAVFEWTDLAGRDSQTGSQQSLFRWELSLSRCRHTGCWCEYIQYISAHVAHCFFFITSYFNGFHV